MTASEMRAIAHKNGNFDEEVKKYTSHVENWIRSACENGKTSTHFCSVYKFNNSDVYEAVMAHFEKDGFTFRQEQRVIGGVLQNPSYYIHW